MSAVPGKAAGSNVDIFYDRFPAFGEGDDGISYSDSCRIVHVPKVQKLRWSHPVYYKIDPTYTCKNY